jgi:hypothetical protein
VTHQPPAYAVDVNLLDKNTHTAKKNTGTLLVSSKELGLGINAEKTKH